MVEGTELFEIIHTTRAMRRLKPDPVPDALIKRILEAGQCAPNGANAQQWRFLIVKDPAIKQAVQVWYQRAFDEVIGPHYRSSAPPPGMDRERYQRQAAAVQYLTEHFHETPSHLREGDRGCTRLAAWRPFLRHHSHWLSHGKIRPDTARSAANDCLRGSLGSGLGGRLKCRASRFSRRPQLSF